MKKFICLILSIIIVCMMLPSCSNPDGIENPCDVKSVIDPYTYENGVFEITLYDNSTISPSSRIVFNNAFLDLYYDENCEIQAVNNTILPEKENETYYIKATSPKGESKIYVLKVHKYIFDRLELVSEYDKDYYVGDAFDKSTISVYGITENSRIKIEDYKLKYDFSNPGICEIEVSFLDLKITFERNVLPSEYLILDDEYKLGNGLEFSYSKKEDGFYISSGENYQGYLSIPKTVKYNGKVYPVLGIKEYCFIGNENITGVISNSKLTIGEGAFKDCQNLERAIFNYETVFAPFCFDGCYYLKDVVLPSDLIEIPYNMFSSCYELTNIVLPDTIKSIGSQAFFNCYCIEEMILPQSIEFLGNRAFKNCESLICASVGCKTSFVGEEAFANCINLEILVLPALTTYEDSSIINGCEKVIVYTGNENSLLHYLQKSEKPYIVIPNNSLYIINDKETYTWGHEFDESSLTIISYYNDDISIKKNFTTSYSFIYPGENTVYVYTEKQKTSIKVFVEYDYMLYSEISYDGEIFSFDYSNNTCSLDFVPNDYFDMRKSKIYIVPTHVTIYGNKFLLTKISKGAFDAIVDMERLILPSSINEIEDEAIKNCTSLKIVYIPTPKGQKLKVGDGNFTNLNDDLLIMCALNNSIMHYYVRTNNMKYSGVDSLSIYVNAQRGAKTTYKLDEEFVPSGYYCIFVNELYYPEQIDMNELTIEYDFEKSNVVTFKYGEYECEYKVSLE